MKPWELEKRLQFIELRDLVRTVASLDNGNQYNKKINHCIELAEKLEDAGFIDFLCKQAMGESDEWTQQR